jgi:DNA-binding NtrC family response regulator
VIVADGTPEAARRLGLSRKTLERKCAEWAITRAAEQG